MESTESTVRRHSRDLERIRRLCRLREVGSQIEERDRRRLELALYRSCSEESGKSNLILFASSDALMA